MALLEDGPDDVWVELGNFTILRRALCQLTYRAQQFIASRRPETRECSTPRERDFDCFEYVAAGYLIFVVGVRKLQVKIAADFRVRKDQDAELV